MKYLIKKILNEQNVSYKKKPGFPDIGHRDDNKKFGLAVRKIENAWYFYDTELYSIKNDNKILKLGTGNPIKCKPFPYAIRYLKRTLNKKLYEYPPAAGDEMCRYKTLDYLKKLGYNNLTIDNTIITCSTTQAFYLILKSIFRPNDVIIMTGPNYGLFAFMPERLNINVEILKLKKEDDYLVNPDDLENIISKINNKLRNKYKNSDYVPCVKAFLNINPNNPLGTVMSTKEIKLLNKIKDICIKNDVFIIDDLIYRDLGYDRVNMAKPFGTLEDFFDNTISLFGLSKSFGLASARAGLVVANDSIIRLLRNNMFYIQDSSPITQSALIAGTFNDNYFRNISYKLYFKKQIKKYIYNRDLCIAMIDGIENISGSCYYNKIKRQMKKILKSNYNDVSIGIPYVNVEFIPNSGFFLLLNFTQFSNLTNIKTEKQILEYLYKRCNIKFLVGKSFSWPNEQENIIRISYSFNSKELILAFLSINKAIKEELKNETN